MMATRTTKSTPVSTMTTQKDTAMFYTENTENDKPKEDNINGYDAVLFTVCDAFGRPQGKFAVGAGLKHAVEKGIEMPYNKCMLGFHSETPTTLPNYKKTTAVTRLMVPDLTTLQPLSWLCKDNRKVGHVLCDLHTLSGEPDLSSPRQLALKQLDSLKSLGFQIMMAFETEYMVFHKGTLTEYAGTTPEVTHLIKMDEQTQLIYDHMLDLMACGLPVETYMEEYAPGQLEWSYKPQYGIKMADHVHRLRYLTKSLCAIQGLEATFMTRPQSQNNGNGFHCNHSLWTLDGKNAFYDGNNDNKCSSVLGHWTAGLLLHGSALAALMCPTVNCYERLHGFFAPADNNWNYNDRFARLRVKNKGTNIHIEDRMASSACNPYLVQAGLVAAGVDGIKRKLELPPPRSFRPLADGGDTALTPLPKTLEEALQALEQDEVLKKALGENFIQDYVNLCKEFQLTKLKEVANKEPDVRFEAERDLYFHSL